MVVKVKESLRKTVLPLILRMIHRAHLQVRKTRPGAHRTVRPAPVQAAAVIAAPVAVVVTRARNLHQNRRRSGSVIL